MSIDRCPDSAMKVSYHPRNLLSSGPGDDPQQPGLKPVAPPGRTRAAPRYRSVVGLPDRHVILGLCRTVPVIAGPPHRVGVLAALGGRVGEAVRAAGRG